MPLEGADLRRKFMEAPLGDVLFLLGPGVWESGLGRGQWPDEAPDGPRVAGGGSGNEHWFGSREREAFMLVSLWSKSLDISWSQCPLGTRG